MGAFCICLREVSVFYESRGPVEVIDSLLHTSLEVARPYSERRTALPPLTQHPPCESMREIEETALNGSLSSW